MNTQAQDGSAGAPNSEAVTLLDVMQRRVNRWEDGCDESRLIDSDGKIVGRCCKRIGDNEWTVGGECYIDRASAKRAVERATGAQP